MKKIIAAFLAVLFIFSGAFADNKSASERMSEMKKKIAETEKAAESAKEKKEYYDSQIESLQTDIDEMDSVISGLNSEINAANAQLADATQKLEQKEASYNDRLRAIQKRGSTSYLDVIFGADDFSDFLVRLTLVENVIDHDKSMMDEIAKLQGEIASSKQALEQKAEEQKQAQDLIVAQKNQVQALSDKQEAYMAELKKDAAKYKSEYEKAQKQMEAENERNKAANISRNSAGQTVTYNASSATKMQWPIPAGGRISCYYGYRTDPAPSNHTGIDIAISTGTAIIAANDGTVTFAAYSSNGYGNYIDINHGDGSATRYGHCSKLYVKAGQKVKRGETIAAVGSTGWSTGPHLHFEVMINGSRVNPLPYIR